MEQKSGTCEREWNRESGLDVKQNNGICGQYEYCRWKLRSRDRVGMLKEYLKLYNTMSTGTGDEIVHHMENLATLEIKRER